MKGRHSTGRLPQILLRMPIVRGQMGAARKRVQAGFLTATLAGTALFAAAARAEVDPTWADVEDRIQYGFYTEDVRALSNLAAQLAAPAGEQHELRSYYAALANFRLGELLRERNRSQARSAIEQCVEHLDAALKARADFPDALALQSLCLQQLTKMTPWRAPLAVPKRRSQIERAVQLAPKNPRVLMLDALVTSDSTPRIERLQQAVRAFEAERRMLDVAPGWGAADAYVHLGRSYLSLGEPLAAREAFEKALLIAPEFVEARRLLSRITAG